MTQYSSVSEYVKQLQGSRPIEKVLISNNGIAAVKAIRSIRKWAYDTFGNSKAVKFVSMATPEDIKANAEYIRLADEVVQVPGEGTANNYSNVKLIAEIADSTGCDAVWPGWGHASEHPELPEALAKTKRKVVFIGPRPLPMRLLGDKISSSIVAESVGVPTLPWSGSGVTCENVLENLTDEVFEKACIKDLDSAIKSAEKIGYPLMVKASEGGGGKGIRKVTNAEELKIGYEQVKAEVVGSPIFLMKLAGESRHLEVQLIADEHGNVTSLYSRDCSVQRRHQKILEEGPVTVAPKEMVEHMEKSAARLAKSVGYSCAGTAEFLYDVTEKKYYFLELNPRLQVEHPVTEWITDTNLPAVQLHVAMGIPLNRIPYIRRFYGLDMFGTSEIDFETAKPRPPIGHVIAARITAENSEEGFQPTSGAVHELTFRNSTNVWGYFSIRSHAGIHSFSDSQFGHIFAFGKDRNDARKSLIIALSELSIRGDIRNTVEYLRNLVEEEVYINNSFTTTWLDALIAKKSLQIKKPDTFLVVLCAAVHTLHAKAKANMEKFLWFVERGQLPTYDLLRISYPIELIYQDSKYVITGTCSGLNKFTITMNDSHREAEIKELRDGGLLVLTENGESHISYAQEDPNGLRVSVDGSICLFTKEFDPSQLRANVSGKIVRFLVEDGAHISENTAFAELEMMKMIITVNAPYAGRVKFQVVPGSTINQGDIIAFVDLDDKSKIRRAAPFEGKFPDIPVGKTFIPNKIVRNAVNYIKTILAGYDFPSNLFAEKLGQAIDGMKLLANSEILVLDLTDQMSVLRNVIPKQVQKEINDILEKNSTQDKSLLSKFKNAMLSYAEKLSESNRTEYMATVAPLMKIVETSEKGEKNYAVQVISSLLEEYLGVEKYFDNLKDRETIMQNLRFKNKENVTSIFDICLSHARLSRKNSVVRALLEQVESFGLVNEFLPLLNQLSTMVTKPYGDVVLIAKQMLMRSRLPSFQKMQIAMQKYFESAAQYTTKQEQLDALKDVIAVSNYSFDVLMTFLNHPSKLIRQLATEVYIRKSYLTFDVNIADYKEVNGCEITRWKFVNKVAEKDLPSRFTALNKKDAIVGSISTDNLAMMAQESEDYVGFGVIAVFDSIDSIKNNFVKLLDEFNTQDNYPEHSNVLQIILKWNEADKILSDNEFITKFSSVLTEQKENLHAIDIRRITILVALRGQFPLYFTFRQHQDYAEDPIYRHIEPTLAFQLFLRKMSNYKIESFPIKNPSVHVYYAVKKKKLGITKYDTLNKRFFVRTLVLSGDIFTQDNPEEFQVSEAERYLVESLNALEIAMADPKYAPTYANHIFINFLPEVIVNIDMVNEIINTFQNMHLKRLWKLRVAEVEVRLLARFTANEQSVPFRFIATNKTGFNLNIDIYTEAKDPISGRIKYSFMYGKQKTMDGKDVNSPHPLLSGESMRRTIAHNYETSYVYDFPWIFERSLKGIWKDNAKLRNLQAKQVMPKDCLVVQEYVLDETGNKLIPLGNQQVGTNKYGMVVWRMTLKTPEYPKGRDIIVIANDITHQSGSFGPKEDIIFDLASKMSRIERIPRIYLAANSGARIGLATEVQKLFRVAWNDENDPSKGFKYLYVSESDYKQLEKTNSVNAQLIEENGEKRYKIIDVIGKEDGIGVENLKGSGMIAGETSRAYNDVVTISYVASRTVGIGAYLVRLGQRVIHNRRPPILLTGAPALNKVLGREVYSSNLQLGGIQIMYPNGVSHLVAHDDMKGCTYILQWLSYIPEKIGGPLPIIPSYDPIERDIDYAPSRDHQADPRHMLTGCEEEKGWRSGFFDKDSFFETLGGWAKNVIVGRARLGGIPMGVIAVETKSVEQVIPADPADALSQERIVQKAGQVWFPDSAYKTAQAIQDFNKEQLPLMIFANWRGFSGGQRDMFEEILKFGSYIVDGLVAYKQPVFIYIPPFAELRGGAWVVVDPSINSDMMEMYADIESRGGVLEPSGIVEIKYRKEELLDTIRRLDFKYIQLCKELGRSDLQQDEKESIIAQMKQREKLLLPIYIHIAETFCDLHDTAGRMKAKGVIQEVIQWKSSRNFFYWRLRRRLAEEELFKQMSQKNPELDHESKKKYLSEMVQKSLAKTVSFDQYWKDDQKILQWIDSHKDDIEHHMNLVRASHIDKIVKSFCSEDSEAVVNAVLQFISECPESKKNELMSRISEQLNLSILGNRGSSKKTA